MNSSTDNKENKMTYWKYDKALKTWRETSALGYLLMKKFGGYTLAKSKSN